MLVLECHLGKLSYWRSTAPHREETAPNQSQKKEKQKRIMEIPMQPGAQPPTRGRTTKHQASKLKAGPDRPPLPPAK